MTEDGKKQHPIVLDVYLVSTKIVCALVGVPLNVFIAINITRLCRRFAKPRYIFMLGIMFCDLLAFVPVAVELTYFILPEEYVCRTYVAIIGVPYPLLLLNMSFALSDRYIAIKYPLWHHKKLSVQFTIGFLVISSISFIFLVKFVLIFQIVPLRCEVQFVHSLIVGGSSILLFTLCNIMNFVVYRQTKTILARTRNSKHLTINDSFRIEKENGISHDESDQKPADCQQVTTGMKIVVGNDDQNTILMASVVANETNIPAPGVSVHVDNEQISQIELKATNTLIAGVTSLFTMAFPLILLFFVTHFCRFFGGNSTECNFFWIAPYLKELGLVHAAIYNPLIWLIRNDEFRLVLKSK